MTYKGAPLTSINQTWGTPVAFFEFLKDNFGFIPDLDAAASDKNHKAPVYYTEEENSLEMEWFGNVWLNPPFGKVLLPQFLEKCNYEITHGKAERIFCLIPARTDTKWFHEIVMEGAYRIYFIKGRFNFESPYSAAGANAPFPSMLVTYTRARLLTRPFLETLEVDKKFRGW